MRFLLSIFLFVLLGATVQAFEGQQELIAEVNSKQSSWKAGVNARFDGLEFSAMKRLMGFQKPTKSMIPARKIHAVQDLPDNFDSRQQWPNCPTIQEIRDQSDCGSCWAFSTTETASDRVCIATNASTIVHLSSRHLLSCCALCGQGCNGGYPGAAFDWFVRHGVVTGGNYDDFSLCVSYPFPPCAHHVAPSPGLPACPSTEYPTPSCPTSCDSNSTYRTPFAQDMHKFATSYSISSDPNQIMQEIYTNGPVTGAFDVYSDFVTYKSGVYVQTSGQYLGGHAIKIIGWGVENGQKYWLVANSWNNTWGDNGFFKILRGADECGIEDNIVAGLYKQ